jgi:23S rRNA (guanosine2251-2'-O)-methyltransferase
MGIFEALKELKRNDIPTYCLMMDGQSIYKTKLNGAVALILGAEDKGISMEVASKCRGTISIPMKKGLDSLNVGISAGIVLYEKVRQEMIE